MSDEAALPILFVGGLHRSGTTLIARAIARHPEVSGIENTAAIEQEGQFLQSALPTDQEFGGPGRFAFAPQSHQTEACSWATEATAASLAASWGRFRQPGRPLLVEKSPPNLLRTRLLQALFPNACFVLITRHPVAVTLATQKWTRTSPFSLLFHWTHAHRLMRGDLPHLARVRLVSYERFVADPQAALREIWEFAGLPPHWPSPWAAIDAEDRNPGYLARWQRELQAPAPAGAPGWRQRIAKRLRIASAARRSDARFRFGRRLDALDAVRFFEPEARAQGYSLQDLSVVPDY